MPKRNKEEYEDDDGFVEDAPVSKAQNGSKKQKLSKPSSKPSGNMGNGPVPGGGQRGNDREYWEVSILLLLPNHASLFPINTISLHNGLSLGV